MQRSGKSRSPTVAIRDPWTGSAHPWPGCGRGLWRGPAVLPPATFRAPLPWCVGSRQWADARVIAPFQGSRPFGGEPRAALAKARLPWA